MRFLGLSAVVIATLALVCPAAAAEDLKGTFVKKANLGTWNITFDGKGKFVAMLDGRDGVKGTYKITKDEIELNDEDGPYAGKGDDKMATYTFKLDGKKLTFTKVKDTSEGRSSTLTGDPWEKKE